MKLFLNGLFIGLVIGAIGGAAGMYAAIRNRYVSSERNP